MGNIYYQPGHTRGDRVQDLFGAIAPRYDLINDLQSFGLHRLWKKQVARLADVQPGMRTLDVCCGTGDIAYLLARRGALATGIDFSLPMLRIAQGKGGAGAPVRWLAGDAQKLPFEDDTFDAVTVGYGLRNLANWQRGLEAMWRVARGGGRLVALEFDKPANHLWRGLYLAYLGACVPLLGRVFCRNAAAYAYILESLKQYPGAEGVAAHLRSLGARDARVIRLLGGVMTINVCIK
ncbi:MAG: ubiquinone/menaquinone biosynthesis methyltransferase [Verrucomicrobia subdivision 3 bacterium]|nr:ubiquinone/menaquinone biosynthesis methyltransferase [Limisphaerales bacterium]